MGFSERPFHAVQPSRTSPRPRRADPVSVRAQHRERYLTRRSKTPLARLCNQPIVNEHPKPDLARSMLDHLRQRRREPRGALTEPASSGEPPSRRQLYGWACGLAPRAQWCFPSPSPPREGPPRRGRPTKRPTYSAWRLVTRFFTRIRVAFEPPKRPSGRDPLESAARQRDAPSWDWMRSIGESPNPHRGGAAAPDDRGRRAEAGSRTSPKGAARHRLARGFPGFWRCHASLDDFYRCLVSRAQPRTS